MSAPFGEDDGWSPYPAQERYLRSPAFEAGYGGAAGGGKTDALLIDALRYVDRPRYHALLMRREAKQLHGTLLLRAHEIYPRVGGKWRGVDSSFHWPNGARIEFGSAKEIQAVKKYQGASLQFLGFDEGTHFTEWQYLYMLARVRGSHVAPLRVRIVTNPGGIGHEWVLQRFGAFLYPREGDEYFDPNYEGPFADDGEILWFLRDRDGREHVVDPWTPRAKTRTFFKARVSDNHTYAGSEYEDTLWSLQLLDRLQLLHGNWMARPSAGMFFRRPWWQFSEAWPSDVLARVRYWDLASTPAERAQVGTAWTAGLRLSRDHKRRFFVEDVVRGQWSPGDVKAAIRATCETDPDDTLTIIEHDPGQAGDAQAFDFVQFLAGFNVRTLRPQGDKMQRAKPASSQAEVGNLILVKGKWNAPFIREGEAFPDSEAKDQIDSLSGALNHIARFPGFRTVRRGKREMTMETS